MARQPSGPGIQRDHTVQGQRTSVVLIDFHEFSGRDAGELEVWRCTDRLSCTPGGRACLHVTTTPHCDLEIVRHGVTPKIVYRVEVEAGAMHQMPEDRSVNDCDWRSGGCIVLTSVRRGDERFDHRHLFIARAVVPVCATGSRIACNEWGDSNHCEGMTGSRKDEFSTRLSMHRPWSRGLVWQPKGVPRITRNMFDRQLTAGVDCG